ncbi:MAG: zinc-dependent metalloprotease [Acidimicrobiia bacterium]|nr:zinc-dependent metalloprotease [Acidimicrobiia bacterium]
MTTRTGPGPAAGSGGTGGSTRQTIDWGTAEAVAVLTSRRTEFPESPASVTMPAELRTLTNIAQELVEGYTGLTSLAGEARAEVIDRPRWIRSNVAGFRHLLEPLAERLTGSTDADADLARVGRAIGAKLLGAELGLLLGFLSQRVLGQYDLILAEEAASAETNGAGSPVPFGGVVYYVGPNVLGIERRFGFSPRDFRLWIALHEVTHRTQFTAVPWLRPYFLELVDGSLGAFAPEGSSLGELVETVIDRLRSGTRTIAADGIMGVFANDEQRAALDRMQSLMTLLEGHGNAVMDALGAEHVEGQAYMSRTLQARRHPTGLSRIVMRLLGMDMKMRQYEEGQRFVEAVLARCGPSGLDPAWAGREGLPTLDEIRADPEEWIGRVHGARVH